MALANEIEKAPRRCDQYVDAAAQRCDLRILADAAEDRCDAQIEVTPVRFEVFADLNGEFARRRKDQRAYGIRAGRRAVLREPLQDRYCKCGGFAGTGLRNAEQIVTREKLGNRLRLNRRRVFGNRPRPKRGTTAR